MATEPAHLPDGSVDPTVVIPKNIRDQAAAAEALHKQAYAEPQPEQQPQPEPQPQPEATLQPEQQPQPEPEPQPRQDPPDADENSQTWKHKFLSMQGRWQGSQKQLGEMTEINSQLANELRATQQLLEQNSSQARTDSSRQHQQTGHPHEKLITPQDVDTYGQEMIDVVQRAAREAVGPEIDALRGENAELKKRVLTTGQRDVQALLARDIPNWVAINRSPEFAQWLSLRNIYTGQVRREMLNAAYQAANAPTVVQLFKDFLTEVRATGGTPPASQRQQQPPSSQTEAPRQPAMQLETLAAPGRARPAPGDSSVPAEKPIYTRALISKNYSDRRRGLWNGRDNDWNMLEADMIAAGNEGRVRG
jgi:hypothetical protein